MTKGKEVDREILIDTGFIDTRAVVTEDGEPVEIYIESLSSKGLVGNIYRGIVKEVIPGMQAAFVDIGLQKNAFLHVNDIISPRILKRFVEETAGTSGQRHPGEPIEKLLKPGHEITVQVTREPIDAKGAKITMYISLSGRYIVFTPNHIGTGVSKKIKAPEEKNRLKKIADRFCPEGMGMIMRTAAEGVGQDKIDSEIRILRKLWEDIRRKEYSGPVPRCIYQDFGMVQKLVRDYIDADIRRFVFNDQKEYQKVVAYLDMMAPELKSKVEVFRKEYDLFAYYHVESAVREALSRKVWLPSGGYLIFDRTEAFTVIDVNTGKFTGKRNLEETIFKVNCEAAYVIGKQLRLRDIGGIILVDFIDMKKAEHREQLLSAIKEAVSRDRNGVAVEGITSLGIVEMTRKKVKESLGDVMTTTCPLCGGTGRLLSPEEHARRVIKEISEMPEHSISNRIEVEVHPDIYVVLSGRMMEEITKMEACFQKKITVLPSRTIEYGKTIIREVDTV